MPFARCVAAGLSRLPSHRGATMIQASPTAARLGHADRPPDLLTEWGFLAALTEPSPDLPGDTDVLIWSMTARRTRLLEPDGDQRRRGPGGVPARHQLQGAGRDRPGDGRRAAGC